MVLILLRSVPIRKKDQSFSTSYFSPKKGKVMRSYARRPWKCHKKFTRPTSGVNAHVRFMGRIRNKTWNDYDYNGNTDFLLLPHA